MDDNFKALLKKELFCAVIANGSMIQKENAIGTAQKAYEWCLDHVGQAQAPTTDIPAVRISRKR